MSAPVFDTAQLHDYATAQSIQRGRDYFREGAVEMLVRRGNELEADVQGSMLRPYRVWIEFRPQGGVSASCTCPYDYGGWCKHIVATLLAYAKQPEVVETRLPLAEKLAELNKAQLQALLLELADRIPRLNDMIETTLHYILLKTAPGSGAPVAVNTRALRHNVRSAIHSCNDWDEGYQDDVCVIDDIVELAEQAQPALEAGDGRTALTILEAVTDELSKHWEMLDEIGEDTRTFFDHTLSLWSEALLDPALNAEESEYWANRLGDWIADFDQTVADSLKLLQTVVRQGWDDPTLSAILCGEEAPGGLWGADPPPYDQRASITQARLRILERTGQHEAYLHLANAERQYDDYALKLLQLDRVREAITAGLEQPLSDEGLLELARALYEHGEMESAFQVAERGLHRLAATAPSEQALSMVAEQEAEFGRCGSHSRNELAVWLRDRAAEQGQLERALAAGELAFRIAPSLAAYQKIKPLAGAHWPDVRRSLLEFLRQGERYISAEIKVDVFLHEQQVDDAIAAVRDHHVSPQTLARVMDAAIPSQPDWVIAQARQQAESIMDGSKSAYYEDAAQWLRKVRQAYEALGQKARWRAYLDTLCDKHQRKYKLMPLLRAL